MGIKLILITLSLLLSIVYSESPPPVYIQVQLITDETYKYFNFSYLDLSNGNSILNQQLETPQFSLYSVITANKTNSLLLGLYNNKIVLESYDIQANKMTEIGSIGSIPNFGFVSQQFGFDAFNTIAYVAGVTTYGSKQVVSILTFDFGNQQMVVNPTNIDTMIYSLPISTYDSPNFALYTFLYNVEEDKDSLLFFQTSSNYTYLYNITNQYPGGDIVYIFHNSGIIYVAKLFAEEGVVQIQQFNLHLSVAATVQTINIGKHIHNQFQPFVFDESTGYLVLLTNNPTTNGLLNVYYINIYSFAVTSTSISETIPPNTWSILAPQ